MSLILTLHAKNLNQPKEGPPRSTSWWAGAICFGGFGWSVEDETDAPPDAWHFVIPGVPLSQTLLHFVQRRRTSCAWSP